jgi:hypothetical protein
MIPTFTSFLREIAASAAAVGVNMLCVMSINGERVWEGQRRAGER